MKKYIVYNSNKIGYIKNICTCNKCKEQGMTEVFINDLDDNYLDCIKRNEIENIIYLGDSLTEAINELVNYFERKIQTREKENQYLQELVNMYSKLNKNYII